MKTVTHKLWPVSWMHEGRQIDSLWTSRPGAGMPECWEGEPIEVTVEHPEEMGEEYRLAEIAELEKKLEALRSVA